MAPSGATPLFPCEVGPPCLSMSFACFTGEIFVQHQIKNIFLFCSAPAFPPFITLQLTTGQEASAHPIASALLPFTRKHASHSPGLPNHPTACTPLCKMLQILAFPTFYALPVLGITQPRWKIGGKLPVRRTFLHRNIRDVIASPSSLLH